MNKKIRKELFLILGYIEWECNGRKFGKVLRNISLKARNVRKTLIYLTSLFGLSWSLKLLAIDLLGCTQINSNDSKHHWGQRPCQPFNQGEQTVCNPLSFWWVISLCWTLQAGANFVSDQGISQQCGLSNCGRHWCWHSGIFQKWGVPGWGILLESPFYMEGCSIKGFSSQEVHRSCGVSKVMEHAQRLHESDWKIPTVYVYPFSKISTDNS